MDVLPALIQFIFPIVYENHLFYYCHFYSGEEGGDKQRPVIIHRAILGSVERMIAILCENYGGKW